MDAVHVGAVRDLNGTVLGDVPAYDRKDAWFAWFAPASAGKVSDVITAFDAWMHGDVIPAEVRLTGEENTVAHAVPAITQCASGIHIVLHVDEVPAEKEVLVVDACQRKIAAVARDYTAVVVEVVCANGHVLAFVNGALLAGALFPLRHKFLQGLHITVLMFDPASATGDSVVPSTVPSEHELTPEGQEALTLMAEDHGLVEVVVNHHSVYCSVPPAVAQWATYIMVYLAHKMEQRGVSLGQDSVAGHPRKYYEALQHVDSVEWPAAVAAMSFCKNIAYNCRAAYGMRLLQEAYQQDYVPVQRDFSVAGLPLGTQLIILKLDEVRLGLPYGRSAHKIVNFMQAAGAFSLATALYVTCNKTQMSMTCDLAPVMSSHASAPGLRVLV